MLHTEEEKEIENGQSGLAEQKGVSQEILYLTRDDGDEASMTDGEGVGDEQISPADPGKLVTLLIKLHAEVKQDCRMRQNLEKKLNAGIEACK